MKNPVQSEIDAILEKAMIGEPRNMQQAIGPSEIHYNLIEADTGCWEWMGHLNHSGYGLGSFGGRTRSVHRYVYELLVGAIPEGLQLDHLCRNRRCANPQHLEPVTAEENTRRAQEANGIGAYATHCPQGHAYDDENTYVDERGFRYCKKCQRKRTREWRNEKRGGPPKPYGAAVTECVNGHPYTPENTGYRKDGRRRCKQCDRDRASIAREKRKGTL